MKWYLLFFAFLIQEVRGMDGPKEMVLTSFQDFSDEVQNEVQFNLRNCMFHLALTDLDGVLFINPISHRKSFKQHQDYIRSSGGHVHLPMERFNYQAFHQLLDLESAEDSFHFGYLTSRPGVDDYHNRGLTFFHPDRIELFKKGEHGRAFSTKLADKLSLEGGDDESPEKKDFLWHEGGLLVGGNASTGPRKGIGLLYLLLKISTTFNIPFNKMCVYFGDDDPFNIEDVKKVLSGENSPRSLHLYQMKIPLREVEDIKTEIAFPPSFTDTTLGCLSALSTGVTSLIEFSKNFLDFFQDDTKTKNH